MRRYFYILFALLAMTWVSTSPMHAKEQYIDPVFGDTIDRNAEDFVIASLLIADPGEYAYSVYGHMAIRLLCNTFNLDKCFTYNMIISDSSPIIDFFAKKLKMGMVMYSTDEYCSMYSQEGRQVKEYRLNLSPKMESELWRVLDERAVNESYISFDYYNHTCAIECVRSIKRALGNDKIDYDDSLLANSPTGRELGKKYTDLAPWVQFIFCFVAGSDVDVPLYGDKQLLIPVDVITAWQKATINGEPLLAQEPVVLVEGEPQNNDGWFTPLLAMLLLLVLCIANLFWSKPYGDWVMLTVQTIIGAFMMYLICFSDLCCTSWNWLIVPFNILPAIAWHWRKYWALPYACALLIWSVVMSIVAIWGQWLCGWPHIVLVLAWVLVLVKQSPIVTVLYRKNQ